MSERAYLDDNHNVIPADDVLRWALWFENGKNRIVEQTTLHTGEWVSTVFLGYNHGFIGPALWFETMVTRNGKWLGYQKRYATWDEAVAGHRETIRMIESGEL